MISEDLLPHRAWVLTRQQTGVDASNCPVYDWLKAETQTACRFMTPKTAGALQFAQATEGQQTVGGLVMYVGPAAALTQEHRVETTEDGYAGTYAVRKPNPIAGGDGPVDHYEAELEVLPP